METTLTKEEYKDIKFVAKIYRKNYSEWRIGQSFFNVLYSLKPKIADKIRATEYNMFHSNNWDWEKDFIKQFVK